MITTQTFAMQILEMAADHPPLPPAIGLGLEAAPWSRFLRESTWTYPLVETLHILAFSTLVGAAFISDLRILGIGRQVSVRALHRITIPISLGASLIIGLTGLTLFSAHASELIGNPAFIDKMMLLFAATINALIFLTGPYQSVSNWDSALSAPRAARVAAILSIILWSAVIAFGRLIAYV